MSKKGFGKIMTGVGIGLGLGFLFAPKSGEQTRKELKEKLEEMINRVRNLDSEDVKKTIETKVNELKTDIDDIDEMSAEFIDKQIAIFTKIIENTPKVKEFTGTSQPHEVDESKKTEDKPFSSLGAFFGKQ